MLQYCPSILRFLYEWFKMYHHSMATLSNLCNLEYGHCLIAAKLFHLSSCAFFDLADTVTRKW